jgi:4'-phosphopantetheinyl transferase
VSDENANRRSSLRTGTEILFVDLGAASGILEAAETAAPRLATGQVDRFRGLLAHGNADAQLWRSSHIALRIALERHVGQGIRGLAYDIEAGGRPRLPRPAELTTHPHFSLSHAGRFALIAISHTGPVGIDLEVEREIKINAERRQRMELAAIRLSPEQALPADPDARFLQAWVRLEAAAKSSGYGIGQILTASGAVGSGKPNTLPVSEASIRDLAVPVGCFAAIAGVAPSSLLTIEHFPVDAAALEAFTAQIAHH